MKIYLVTVHAPTDEHGTRMDVRHRGEEGYYSPSFTTENFGADAVAQHLEISVADVVRTALYVDSETYDDGYIIAMP